MIAVVREPKKSTRKPGRPSERADPPIRAPLPVRELIEDVFKAGPHPKERKAPKPKKC
jgi:hypothetical protein